MARASAESRLGCAKPPQEGANGRRIAVAEGLGVHGGVLRRLIASTRWCDIAKEAVGIPILILRAKRTGARIFWLDEAAIRSDDPLQRTWGRKGETPVVATSGQRQAINAISALTNRGAFWYHGYTGRLNADKFIECLRDFLASQRGKVIVIMDGHPVHKAKKVQQWLEQRADRIEVEFLPGYAPDLNPDELVWQEMRHKGTSKKPLKKGESLKQRAINDLEAIKNDKALIRSLFRAPTVRYAAA